MKKNTLLTSIFCSVLFLFLSCNKDELISHNISITGTQNTIAILQTSITLDEVLNESSSIEIDDNGTYWSNNDHGNSPVLYGFNKEGKIETEIQLQGVQNNDWEDLALDENDNLFVGDFGNNDNSRTDLAIYIIPNFSSLSSCNITPQIIHFNFEDQTKFPPPESEMHFGVEASIVVNDTIYLFTKDRSKPFAGITKLYSLPAASGTYEAKLLNTFSTSCVKKEGAITSADISPDGTKLTLLSEQRIYLFSNFQTPDFFAGDLEIFTNPLEKKFEGIAFENECELILTNEKNNGEKPNLLRMDICN